MREAIADEARVIEEEMRAMREASRSRSRSPEMPGLIAEDEQAAEGLSQAFDEVAPWSEDDFTYHIPEPTIEEQMRASRGGPHPLSQSWSWHGPELITEGERPMAEELDQAVDED